MDRLPIIIPLENLVSLDTVCATSPAPIYAADFYVTGAEKGVVEPGGLRLGRVLNVDHHAPIRAMESPRVTSTVLAHAHGPIEPDAVVVLNHADCDSMLSSAVLLGLLEPDQSLVNASIAADHTGGDDPVANLLQSLDEPRRGDRTLAQYQHSLDNLRRHLDGRPLTPDAATSVAARLARRQSAAEIVARGAVGLYGSLAFGILGEDIDGACFPPLLPGAAVIMLATRHARYPDRWAVKLRLGAAAPVGLTLPDLGVRDWDPEFGGRWNAGSNKRGGGTLLDLDQYADHLSARLRALGL